MVTLKENSATVDLQSSPLAELCDCEKALKKRIGEFVERRCSRETEMVKGSAILAGESPSYQFCVVAVPKVVRDKLTQRERDVVTVVGSGKGNEESANELSAGFHKFL